MVKQVTNRDRAEMEETIPAVVGDYHRQAGASAEAVRLYIRAFDYRNAEELTTSTLETVKASGKDRTVLSECMNHWKKVSTKPTEKKIALLVEMFRSPIRAAQSSAK